MNLQEHRRKVLGKLGFVKKGGTKHERWILMDDEGRPHVTTRVSRNNRDIGPSLRGYSALNCISQKNSTWKLHHATCRKPIITTICLIMELYNLCSVEHKNRAYLLCW